MEKSNCDELVNSLPYGLALGKKAEIVVDVENIKIDFFNPEFERLSQIIGLDKVGLSNYELRFADREIYKKVTDAVKSCIYDGGTKDVEIGSDNESHHINVTVFSISKNGIGLVLRESSPPESSMARIENREKKLRLLLDESNDPIFSFTNEGRYLYVNRAFANGVQKPLEDIIGKKIWDVFPKDEADKRFAALSLVFQSGEERVIEVKVPRDTGAKYYITTITPIKDDDGAVHTVICSSKDITARKLAEDENKVLIEQYELAHSQLESALYQKNAILEELSQSKAQLESAIAQKDKFFSIIAHDLRNPLGSFKYITKLLADSYQSIDEADRADLINMIKDSSRNLYNLLENLLDWSRSQRGNLPFHPIDFDLKFVVTETLALLNLNATNKGIDLVDDIKSSTNVFGDPNLITTVIRNLVSNAIKFTPQGGKIVVSSENLATGVEVAVSDSGIGMTDEIIKKLFRIDETVTSAGTNLEKGTGLGLILCKEFVEKHGGVISVESTPGAGSVFRFTIPYAKE